MCPPLDWMLGLKRKAKTPSPPHRTCILSEAADTKWTAAVPHDENHDGKRWGHRGKAHDPALGGGAPGNGEDCGQGKLPSGVSMD